MSPLGLPHRKPHEGVGVDHVLGAGGAMGSRESLSQLVTQDGKVETRPYAEPGRGVQGGGPPQRQRPPESPRPAGVERLALNEESLARAIAAGGLEVRGLLESSLSYYCPVAPWPLPFIGHGVGLLITTASGARVLACNEEQYEKGLSLLIEQLVHRGMYEEPLFCAAPGALKEDENVAALRELVAQWHHTEKGAAVGDGACDGEVPGETPAPPPNT